METPAGISGEPNTVVVGELGRSLNIRCLAYGYPQPAIYWYHESAMLPYSSELYEARENVLQIRKLELETLGEYACQAFNGVGKAAFWSVSVRAYAPDERWTHPLLLPRERTVDITPAARVTQPTTQTTPPPEIDMPVYTGKSDALERNSLFPPTTTYSLPVKEKSEFNISTDPIIRVFTPSRAECNLQKFRVITSRLVIQLSYLLVG